MRRIPILSFLLALALGLSLACGGDSGPPTSDVFGRAPWPSSESLVFQVKSKNGELLGRHTLSVDVQGAVTVVSQAFRSETNTDETRVVVDSATFKPQTARREITTPRGRETLEVTYTPDGALIRQGNRQSGLSVPEHAYDNDTSLFLWRTLPFAEGYESSYRTVITNRRNLQKVTLTVLGKETVKVPAGEFTAWKLEIRTSNARQTAWYADTPERPLVRYDNDHNAIFELESLPRTQR